MKLRLIKDCGLAVALFAAGFSLHAADAAKPTGADKSKPAGDAKQAVAPPVKQVPPADAKKAEMSADVQKLVEQFQASRDKSIASQEALKAQMKNATEEQKKTLQAQLEKERKDLLEQQRVVGKQIRDDMRKQRQNAATTPPR
jgi:hypothetical protein